MRKLYQNGATMLLGGQAVSFSSFTSAMLAVLLVTLSATPSAAQLVVDKLWIDLDSSASGREDVVMKNESEIRYYISVVPSEIVRPGLENQERVELSNPEDLGLLVSPGRLVLEPGATRSLRLVSINPELDTDRVYRIRVTPQVGDIAAQPVQGEERGVNIVMLTAYDLLVVVRPRDPKVEIVARREGNELVLRNTGNSNTLLVDGKTCALGQDDESCQSVSDVRLYAGAELRVPLQTPDAKFKVRARDTTATSDRSLEF